MRIFSNWSAGCVSYLMRHSEQGILSILARNIAAKGIDQVFLTFQPSRVSSEIMVARWSPCISMLPSLTVPPEPQRCLSAFPKASSSALATGAPSMTVTPLPLRPLVSRRTRTMPSGFDGGLFDLQTHFATGFRQLGHMRPCSVE